MTPPDWVTVQRRPATVRVPLRAAAPPFACAAKVTTDVPVPPRGSGCNHETSVDALHSQSLSAVTCTMPSDTFAGRLDVPLSVTSHRAAPGSVTAVEDVVLHATPASALSTTIIASRAIRPGVTATRSSKACAEGSMPATSATTSEARWSRPKSWVYLHESEKSRAEQYMAFRRSQARSGEDS